MQLAIDYAWVHPEPAAIKAAGYVAVLRYLSTDPTKNITTAEVEALFAAGLAVAGLVWETTATRATAGEAAGVADAQAAAAQAAAAGYPGGMPIYFAVDEDTTWADVAAYFAGVVSFFMGRTRVEPYGSDEVINGFYEVYGGSPRAWQTEAWSGGTVSPHAAIYQRVTPTRPAVAGAAGDYDEDALLVALPMWDAPPIPPSSPTVWQEDQMKSTPIEVEIANGEGWCESPVPVGQVVTVTAEVIAPSSAGEYVPVPWFRGVATSGGGNGQLVFGPGPSGGPAVPNGTYGFTVWSVTG